MPQAASLGDRIGEFAFAKFSSRCRKDAAQRGKVVKKCLMAFPSDSKDAE